MLDAVRNTRLLRGQGVPGGAISGRLSALALPEGLGAVVAGWVLPFVLVLYLALKGGGYDEIVYGQVGIAVWWIVLLGALVGVLPVARVGRAGWLGLGLLVMLAAWTALGIGWSESAERSFVEVGRVAMYAGVFALALTAQGRDGVMRTVNAVATAIGVVAALALLSRFHPELFPTNTTAQFLPSVSSRLNYPLNYWNGLAALTAIGIPLMLAVATGARRAVLQALAAAALPVMALTTYYTFSRGGALETAVGLIALFALYPRRLALLPTLLTGALGSAILIAAARQRAALDHALGDATAHSQGNEMLALALIICTGVALVQVAIFVAARYEVGPRLWISRRAALIALAASVLTAIAIAIPAGVPGQLSDDWQQFKNPSVGAAGAQRFTSVSGNGRYQYWQSSVDANATDPLKGIGPGTWEFWWAEHATIAGPVLNAHSLYFETLGEVGIVGLLLVAGLFIWVLAVGTRRAFTAPRDRALIAAATAAAFAFVAAAGIDWVWQLPVIPIAFLLLAATILAPQPTSTAERAARPLRPRLVMAALALVSLIAIGVPLAGISAIRASEANVRAGDLSAALDQAKKAEDIEPYAGTPYLQEALVYERGGDLDAAAAAASEATSNESTNWRAWVILSRIETKLGNGPEANAAYRKAKSLNPQSVLFAQ